MQLEIQNAEGETIGKWYKKETRVTSEKISQKMTYLLKGVVEKEQAKRRKLLMLIQQVRQELLKL